MTRSVLVVMMLALASGAHAEDIVAYEAEGDAPVGGTDARTAALDDAFARAVGSALGDLVAGDVRTAHKGELDKEIVGHARLWVAKFTVTKDDTEDARRQLTVSVRIDRDKIRARLDELKVPTKEASAAPADGQRAVTILLRVATSKGVHASFGKSADHDTIGLGGLATVFRGAGMAVRRAPDTGTVAADGDLPISDADADALADTAKADLIAIAGVTVGDAVAVRGQPQPAVLVAAHLRLFDHRSHALVGQGTALAAAGADDPRYAIDRALAAAASDVLPPAPKKLGQAAAFTGDDTPFAEPGVVLVRLGSKTPYSMVLAEQKFLAGAKGVRAASLRRLSPAGWVIGVTTGESLERVAQIAKKPPATDTSASVKIVGDIVEVALSGSP
ncbi:MAG TPA: hypothetical protein VFQ65_20410 [Kofleriaceae bacterium]|nr:hypothetical protein [Kofleriaceae bacterium]